MLGSNGAGERQRPSRLSRAFCRRPGTVIFRDKDITTTPSHTLPVLGLGHVPEGRRIFSGLSVADNLLLGAFHRNDRQGIKDDLESIYELFPRLRERRKQNAGSLSGGEQQMLAMGRGLMGRPKLLLLDEPSMGLAPILVQEIFEIIQEINRRGTTILLVEQNAHLALQVSHKACVLKQGGLHGWHCPGSGLRSAHSTGISRGWITAKNGLGFEPVSRLARKGCAE